MENCRPKKISRWLKRLPPLLSIGWLALYFCGCKENRKADETPAPKISGDEITFLTNAPQLTNITIEPAREQPASAIKLSGRLVWDDDVTVRIYSPVAGRVLRIPVELNQTLAAGDALAEIDSPDFGQALADARTAAANFAAADKAFARARELFAHGAAAQKDLEVTEAARSSARAEKERSLARLANYGGSEQGTNAAYVLRTPLAGVLVEKSITPGQEIRSDLMLANAPQLFIPLFVVTSPSRLWVQLDVPDSELARLKPGLPVTIRSAAVPDDSFAGKIDVVSESLDEVTHTVMVRGSVDNASRKLKAGMFVNAELPVEAPARLQVPAKAVFLRGGEHCVFIEEHPGDFRRREVKLGETAGDNVAVLDGVRPGERVVSDGALLLEEMFD
jgi:cobalt-zinc-cadmium efflux system membrane fusion protein